MAIKSKHDPLEAAKLPLPGDVPTPEPEAPAAPEPEIEALLDAEPAPPGPVAKTYRVLETKKFSWHGQMTALPAGEVVSEAGYGGAVGIAKLRDCGVKLEEI